VFLAFRWGNLKILPGLPRRPSQKGFETSSVSQHSDGPVGLSNLLWLGTWLLRWRRTTVLFPCLIPAVTLGRDRVEAVAAVNSPFFPCLILGGSLSEVALLPLGSPFGSVELLAVEVRVLTSFWLMMWSLVLSLELELALSLLVVGPLLVWFFICPSC
jgi:hypothetical protein